MTKRVVLAWWFFYVAGSSSGIAGPFPSQGGCDYVRANFLRFLRGMVTSECVADQ